MLISEILRLTSFLLPIPFMLLFYIKTDKLDFIKNNSLIILLFPILASLLLTDIGYNIELVLAYTIFVLFGTQVFKKANFTYPQAISISFCLTYFASFLWEIPTHIYTIILNQGIDGALPLHLIYIFPMIFIYEKLKTNQTKKHTFKLLLLIFGYSTAVLISTVLGGYDIFIIKNNPLFMQGILEASWMTNRIIVVITLFLLYSKSSFRRKNK